MLQGRMPPRATVGGGMLSPVIINKSSLVQLAVLLLLCVDLAPGLFIFTGSCGDGNETVGRNLPLDPLEGTWFMTIDLPSDQNLQLTSQFNQKCFLKSDVMFQLRQLNDSVEIVHSNTVYCNVPMHHQWLNAPQNIIYAVSCTRDETVARGELLSINTDNNTELISSREGKVLDTSIPAYTEIISTDLPEGVTIPGTVLNNVFTKSTKLSTPEVEVQTVTTYPPNPIYLFTRPTHGISIKDPQTTLEEFYSTDTSHVPLKTSSSPPLIHTISNEMPKTTVDEANSSNAATPSSTTRQDRSDVSATVTSEPLVTAKPVSHGGFTMKILYIVLVCILIFFVIICLCCLIHRCRKRKKVVEINQRLVNKKENVVNFRAAEEAEAHTTGRKKSKDNVIEVNEVPKCLR